MSFRNEKFASFLKREIALFLERSFPRGNGIFLFVNKVHLDSALARAEVFVSVFPDAKADFVYRNLKKFEWETRRYITSKLRSRKVPRIIFVPDSSQQDEVRLEKLLENIK